MRLYGWFALVSCTACALVNPGNFGTIDTTWRLQVTRWMRLGEPEVKPSGGNAAYGRDGRLHAVYGMGQSIVMLPLDALVSAAVPHLAATLSAEKQEQVEELLVAFLMQSVITMFVLILAHQVLLSFSLAPFVSAAGSLSLLFGTTALVYAQTAEENQLLLALALCALWATQRWDRDGGWWPVLAGAACEFAILTRLPSVLETALFAVLPWFSARSWKRFVIAYLPPVLAALAIDRFYQWVRFGDMFSTYIGLFGKQARPAGAPASYPFSYPFWKGFAGTFLSVDKSVLLFDPLLVVLALVMIWRWRHLDRALRVTLLSFVALLLAYATLYARYFDFGGDVAWGHRFLTLPVQPLALFAAPLLLTHGRSLPFAVRGVAWTLLTASVALQLASTAIAPNLEVMQRDLGDYHGVLWNRAINLRELTEGDGTDSRFQTVPPEWSSLYYLPFQLRFRFQKIAPWGIGAWLALACGLPILVASTLRCAGSPPGGRIADAVLDVQRGAP